MSVITPAQNLEIGKIGLPKLGDGRRLVFELIRGFLHGERRAGDQVMRLERATRRRFRHDMALLVGERDGQLAQRPFRFFQSEIHNPALYFGGHPVSDMFWLW